MYVPAPEIYWLGQKVKGQGHSKRKHSRRRKPVEFHLVYECKLRENALRGNVTQRWSNLFLTALEGIS